MQELKVNLTKVGWQHCLHPRADKSAKENRARAKQLDKDIRGKGLGGATKVTGSYMEKDKKTGKEKKVKERSHVSHQVRWVRESSRRQSKHLVRSMGRIPS